MANTIKATTFEPRIGYSTPKYNISSTSSLINSWVGKQGKHWPPNLNGEQIAPKLVLFYLPYWVVSGEGMSTWTASIGIDRNEFAPCGSCRGTGVQVSGTQRYSCSTCHGNKVVSVVKTYWQRHQDITTANLNGRIVANHNYAIHCGNRDFSASEFTADGSVQSRLDVLTPNGTSLASARSAADQAVKNALISNAQSIANGVGNHTRDLQLIDARINISDVRAFLYPIYLGVVDFHGESISSQVDGITGQVWILAPNSVKNARLADVRRAWYIGLVLLSLIVLAIVAYQANQTVKGIDQGNLAIITGGLIVATLFVVEALVVPITRSVQNSKK